MIARELPSLSRKQRQIGEFVLRFPERAMMDSASTIAQRVGINPSTVVRFAATLGFTGFPGFQKALQAQVQQQMTTVKQLESLEEPVDGVRQYLYAMYTSNMDRLNEGFRRLSPEAFERAVDLLMSSQSVYVVGLFSAIGVAHFFAYSLNLIRPGVQLLQISATTFDQLLHAGKNDVLLLFHLPRFADLGSELAAILHERGIPLILVTDGLWAPGAATAAAVLETPSTSGSYTKSYCATMSLLDALLGACAQRGGNATRRSLEELEALLARVGSYITEPSIK